MNLIVQKFGGSSVANVERVRHVAQIITDTYAKGNSVIAVVSAQGDTTDDLIAKAKEITEQTLPAGRWMSCFPPASRFPCRCWQWQSSRWVTRSSL